MASPDPEGMKQLGTVIGAAAAVFGPVGGLWIWIDSRFAKKQSVKEQILDVKNEQAFQRNIHAKLFDKLEEHTKQDAVNFQRVIEKMGDNHAEVMAALGRKEDRR